VRSPLAAKPATGQRVSPFDREITRVTEEMLKMTASRVAFVMYPVTDMQRAVAFYREVLGFEKSGLESDFWVEFDVAGVTFGLGNFEQVGNPGSAQSFAVEVSDMAAARAELTGRGVDSTEPFETAICYISTVRDPDGNQIVLHQAKP
jgi:predicted enzyme related to lactoylglutathione lyase